MITIPNCTYMIIIYSYDHTKFAMWWCSCGYLIYMKNHCHHIDMVLHKSEWLVKVLMADILGRKTFLLVSNRLLVFVLVIPVLHFHLKCFFVDLY